MNPKVEEPRKGTWDYPYLYAIRKTQASAGRVRNLSCSGIHEPFSPVHNFYVFYKDRLVRAVRGSLAKTAAYEHKGGHSDVKILLIIPKLKLHV